MFGPSSDGASANSLGQMKSQCSRRKKSLNQSYCKFCGEGSCKHICLHVCVRVEREKQRERVWENEVILTELIPCSHENCERNVEFHKTIFHH